MAAPVQEIRPAGTKPDAPKERTGGLPRMKDAVVWAEILGKPKALRRKR